MIRRLTLVAFFIEVGLLLIVLPWSAFWEQNYFAHTWPVVQPLFVNDFVRGGITGLGFVNLVAGVFELLPMFTVRHQPRTTPPDSPGGASGPPNTAKPDARVEP